MYKNSHIREYANSNPHQFVQKQISAKYITFPQNTLHAKYKTFTVFYNKVPITEESNIVLKLPAFYIIQNNWMLKGHAMS